MIKSHSERHQESSATLVEISFPINYGTRIHVTCTSPMGLCQVRVYISVLTTLRVLLTSTFTARAVWSVRNNATTRGPILPTPLTSIRSVLSRHRGQSQTRQETQEWMNDRRGQSSPQVGRFAFSDQ
ncbi:hypothetical protein ElyMa_003520500 [Elysia marginata]|uniref:Uncharacterized protein n=1 Tax=Elysia marginata TaxID=1093978 RepID=A0AAV4EGY0_9GAST|nr:hypothetical protein ElyMa_003520500 [Elysia marginata]